jgi:hypothetical protein
MWRPEYSLVRQAVMTDAVGPTQTRQCRSFQPFTSHPNLPGPHGVRQNKSPVAASSDVKSL